MSETGWYRAGGAFNASGMPIQHAIDNATAGDSIYVYSSSYRWTCTRCISRCKQAAVTTGTSTTGKTISWTQSTITGWQRTNATIDNSIYDDEDGGTKAK